MEKIKLKVGDVFNFTKVSYLYYKILELDRASNYAKIELICPYDVDNWDEDWTLSSIEEGFEVGENKEYLEELLFMFHQTYDKWSEVENHRALLKLYGEILNITFEKFNVGYL